MIGKGFIVAVAVAACAAYLLGGYVTGPSEADVQKQIGDALVADCENNLDFRVENRKRQLAALDSYRIEIQANEALIEVTNAIQLQGETLPEIVELGEQLDKLNRKLVALETSAVVLPLPECDELRALIESQ